MRDKTASIKCLGPKLSNFSADNIFRWITNMLNDDTNGKELRRPSDIVERRRHYLLILQWEMFFQLLSVDTADSFEICFACCAASTCGRIYSETANSGLHWPPRWRKSDNSKAVASAHQVVKALVARRKVMDALSQLSCVLHTFVRHTMWRRHACMMLTEPGKLVQDRHESA